MRVIETVHTIPLLHAVAQPPIPDAPLHVGTVQSLSELAAALPGGQLPPSSYVAAPGDGVWMTHAPGDPAGLMSFGAGDDVLLTVFDADTGEGAVVHIDRNDQHFIDQVIDSLIGQFRNRGQQTKLTASLFGGAWMSSPDDTGARLRDGLVDHGITPTWHQWSFPLGREDQHGVFLDLATGHVTVFEHPVALADEFFVHEHPHADQALSDSLEGVSWSRRSSWSDASATSFDWPVFDGSQASSPRRDSESSDAGQQAAWDDRHWEHASRYRTVFGVSTESLLDE